MLGAHVLLHDRQSLYMCLEAKSASVKLSWTSPPTSYTGLSLLAGVVSGLVRAGFRWRHHLRGVRQYIILLELNSRSSKNFQSTM